VPNWIYLVVNAFYHLGLALWIGGAVALGALTAPVLFADLPRNQAGGIFGSILRRFARVRVLALALIVVGAGAKYVRWETHAATPWLVLRWLAIAFLGFSVVYEIVALERPMRTLQPLLAGDGGETPERARFNNLHRRAEALMKASLFAAFVALFFS